MEKHNREKANNLLLETTKKDEGFKGTEKE